MVWSAGMHRPAPRRLLVLALLLAAVPRAGRGDDAPAAAIAAAPQGKAKRPKAPRWHQGDRTAPVEHDAIGQELAGVHVKPAMLVSVQGQVAGADPIRTFRGRTREERFLVTREVADALVVLRARVKEQFGPEYDIWLNGAYDSSGKAHTPGSLHRSGRAVDLDLYRLPTGKRKEGEKVTGRLDEFAFLVNDVFTTRATADGRPLRGWVLHEGNHVHASLESPSLEPVPPPPTPVAMR
jgi:hypothetical protein